MTILTLYTSLDAPASNPDLPFKIEISLRNREDYIPYFDLSLAADDERQ
jgi:hypothetical protein